MSKRDYYEVLRITKTSTTIEIKKAYRKAAVEHHPDKNPDDPSAEERFKEAGEAYEILSDEQKRAAYDRFGHAAVSGNGGARSHDPFDLFREVFGSGGGGGGGAGGIFDGLFGGGRTRGGDGDNRGADLRYDLEITLEEAATGIEKQLELEKAASCKKCSGSGSTADSSTATCGTCEGHGQVISSRGFFQVRQTCPECRGSGQTLKDPCAACGGDGRVEELTRITLGIPAGIAHGSRIRSTGNGEVGRRGGESGDLYVVVHVKEHDVFERDDNDLFCEIPISFATATLGGELEVPTLDGKSSIKIPPGTQNSTIFRLRNRGIQFLNSSRKGDLMIQVQVEIPTKLNKGQREKLQEFSDSIGQKNSPLHETFFEKAKRFFQ